MNQSFDIAVVGGGIAGASLAAEVAAHARVLLLEAEDQPGYHSTGRSAAFWSETYGGPGVQPLTTASGPILTDPPEELGGESFLKPRGELFIGREGDTAALDAFIAEFADTGVALERVDPHMMLPGLRPDWVQAVYEPTCMDIDVGRLHGAYLGLARRRGVTIVTGAGLEEARREGGGWTLRTRAGDFAAGILVDAGGAWADAVAAAAGVPPIGIAPLRRTMVQLRTDPPMASDLPLVRDGADLFYFKPEAGGRVWLSPHDEVPDEPRDVAPEELDVAIAIDRFEGAVDWRVEAVERRWAGLRSFAPDRLPVYGFDPAGDGFFWFAGQGGFGIQTAPAAAALAASLLTGAAWPDWLRGVDLARYAPDRFR
ncbi:FAD-dependent oxidoreductase [Sphingomonas spermidinifaciens]|uniref:FAD-dependent oxidoreductase n=1 Tax=Sphingomonas spermidinifaciens TaxID=1141889 RepID=A0A2A4B5G5_9SPHN|nr:FAD-dependent oxidoreductase [Sphingomonas spermidinifaciens]PCD03307.1 FAD-dependent oxidoreductase [Sphingomonas spermidinifaciens]